MNKSSSPLLHLHLHLLHFFDNEQTIIFIIKKKKKKRDKIFKKGLGTRGIRLILLRFLSKKIQNFHFLEKIQSKISIPWKNSRFPKFSKKKIQNFQFLEKIQDSSKKIQIFNSLQKFKISKFFKKKIKIKIFNSF